MAVDAEAALRRLITERGGLDEAAAEKYLADMQKAVRYQNDVY